MPAALELIVGRIMLKQSIHPCAAENSRIAPAPLFVDESVADELLSDLRGHLEFKKASVQLIVEGERILIGAFGFDKQRLQSSLLGPVEADIIISEVVATKQPKIIPFTAEEKNWRKQAETSDVESWMCWPLVSQGETIGIITFDHGTPGFYGQLSEKLCSALGVRIASAANNLWGATTRYALERHDRGLDLILNTAKDMLQAASIHQVLNRIVSGAMDLTRADSGVMYLLSADASEVLDKFYPRGGFDHPAPRLGDPNGVTRTIVKTGDPYYIADTEKDGCVHPEVRKEYRSMLGFPLEQDSAVIGVLYLNWKTFWKKTKAEMSLLSALAEHAALAIRIKNAQAMYQAIPQFVLLKDRQSRFRAANASFCRSLSKEGNLHETDILGKRDVDFYKEKAAKDYVSKDEQVMATGQTWEGEELHQSQSRNDPFWVHVVKSPVRDNGNVIGVQAIFWDITEQKRMEERWKSLVDHSPDGIVVHKNWTITLANPAAQALLGVVLLKNRSLWDFIEEGSRPQAEERLRRLVNKQEVEQGVRMRMRTGSGGIVEAEVYSSPGPGENEVQVVMHSLERRNSLLRQVEQLAQQHRRQMKEVAHELRHSLQAILNQTVKLARLLEEQAPGTERPERDAVRVIEDEVFRGQKQTDNVLTLDREPPYTFRQATLCEVIQPVVDHLQNAAARKAIEIKVDPSVGKQPSLRMDTDRIGQVVWNLLDNAIKYGSNGQNVQIRAMRSDRSVTITFENFGAPIPERYRERIFEHDKQELTAEMSNFIRGTGLGLPMVKTLVCGHGGRVWMNSEPAPAEGAEGELTLSRHVIQFNFELPLTP